MATRRFALMLLSLVAGGGALLSPRPAAAHEMSMAEMEVRETAPDAGLRYHFLYSAPSSYSTQ